MYKKTEHKKRLPSFVRQSLFVYRFSVKILYSRGRVRLVRGQVVRLACFSCGLYDLVVNLLYIIWFHFSYICFPSAAHIAPQDRFCKFCFYNYLPFCSRLRIL